jgi:dUTP pyrophosphatase
MDLHACVDEPVTIQPGARALIGTGLAFAIPAGWEGQVRPRSGLAAKHGVTVINSPGTIDSDFRGQVGVVLVNHGQEPFVVKNGERIAQIVFAEYAQATLVDVPELDDTSRGAGGYGSTGR